MKTLFFALFTLGIFTDAWAYRPQIKISEKIYQDVSFSYNDQYNDNYPLSLSRESPNRTIETNAPIWLTDKNGYHYYILPGEDLNIYTDSLQLTASNYDRFIRQNELYFFKAYAIQLGNTTKDLRFEGTASNFSKAIKEYAKKLAAVKNDAMLFAETYTTEHPVSDTFKAFYKQYFDAVYTVSLLKPLNMAHKSIAYISKKDRKQVEQCLGYDVQNPAVRELMMQYLTTAGNSNIHKKDNPVAELTGKIPQNNSDFMLFTMIKSSMLAERDLPETLKVSDITNEEYAGYLAQLKKFQTDNYTDLFVQDISGKSTPLLKAIADSNNKYYYVCFWSNGSTDAQKEVKKQLMLKNKYIHSPVEVVFISLDENPIVWANNCKAMAMGDAPMNYIAPHNYWGKIAKAYKVKQLPHYMVIDNNGYVVSLDANPPTERSIASLLDRFHKVFDNRTEIPVAEK